MSTTKQTVYQLNRPIHHGGCRRLGDQNKHTCQEVTGITELLEAWLLSTKWKWYPHKRRHSRWKLSQELKRQIGYILCKVHVWKWPVVKYKPFKIKPRICVLFILCLTWTVNANSLKQNIIVIQEICSWLPPLCKQYLLLFIQPRWQLRRTYMGILH